VRPRLVLLAVVAALLVGGVLVVALRGDDGEAKDVGSDRAEPAPAQTDTPSSREPEGTPRTGASADCPQARRRGGGRVALERVGSFDQPLYVTAPPGDCRRIFVVEKTGRIRLLVNGKKAPRPFLDLSRQVSTGGEQGLLSMAFAPDYARSRRFYVDYTDRRGDTRVQEFRRSRRSPNRANRATRRQVLFVDQPFENHNGGLVLFGPDRLLYVGLGDGGAGGDPDNRAQRLETLLGKILRIDPRRSGRKSYRSPRSNPFVGRAGRNEIYAYGLRNPWRFSFDGKSGDLYIGDVGQDRQEEVDYARRGEARGRNYGWSCFEGRLRYDDSRSCPAPVGPVLTYSLSGENCAVTGGVVVRDPGLPQLGGHYLYGDACGAQVRSFRIAGGKATNDGSLGLNVPSLSSFGEDAGGGVYLTSLEGAVYRLVSR
jgi:glucose/arabinose dehydrogenase